MLKGQRAIFECTAVYEFFFGGAPDLIYIVVSVINIVLCSGTAVHIFKVSQALSTLGVLSPAYGLTDTKSNGIVSYWIACFAGAASVVSFVHTISILRRLTIRDFGAV